MHFATYMNAHRSLPALYVAGLAGVAGLLVCSTARADRVDVVEETRDPDDATHVGYVAF